VTAYPTRPVSDFSRIVDFACAYVENGFATGYGGWQVLGLGVPLGLSVVFRLLPGDPATLARYTTAVLTGIAAVLPLVIWRGVFPPRARWASTLLLALWPGHVVASGVVSQDNWALLPTIALAALAARVVASGDRGWPVASALLLVSAGAIRQEMLLALLPLALGAAGALRPRREWRARSLATGLLAGALALGLVAGLRWAGSGHFTLLTEHAGLAVLGSYSPGAVPTYWTFPQAAVADSAPRLLHNWTEIKRQSLSLGLQEALRRPLYHVLRIGASIINCQLRSDSGTLLWSVGMDSVLPPEAWARAQAWLPWVTPKLEGAMSGLMVLTLAVGVLALRRRWWPALLIEGAMLLKLGIHGLMTAQPRYLVPVTALALLSVGLGTALPRLGLKEALLALLAGGVAVVLLAWAGASAEAYLLSHEDQRVYRFTVREPKGPARLRCVLGEGLLAYITWGEATIRPLHVEPAPGERAVARCAVETRRTARLAFEYEDAYGLGNLPGRVIQSVEVDGLAAERHDIAAEAWTGWRQVPLGVMQPGEVRNVVLAVTAAAPDRGWAWGLAAATRFRVASLAEEPQPEGERQASARQKSMP
jgi:hypothetical protein